MDSSWLLLRCSRAARFLFRAFVVWDTSCPRSQDHWATCSGKSTSSPFPVGGECVQVLSSFGATGTELSATLGATRPLVSKSEQLSTQRLGCEFVG